MLFVPFLSRNGTKIRDNCYISSIFFLSAIKSATCGLKKTISCDKPIETRVVYLKVNRSQITWVGKTF